MMIRYMWCTASLLRGNDIFGKPRQGRQYRVLGTIAGQVRDLPSAARVWLITYRSSALEYCLWGVATPRGNLAISGSVGGRGDAVDGMWCFHTACPDNEERVYPGLSVARLLHQVPHGRHRHSRPQVLGHLDRSAGNGSTPTHSGIPGTPACVRVLR
jgi:hypothetical protein